MRPSRRRLDHAELGGLLLRRPGIAATVTSALFCSWYSIMLVMFMR